METIRGRLTVWYTAALGLTLAVFAAVLYVARRSGSFQDLDARLQSEADLTAGSGSHHRATQGRRPALQRERHLRAGRAGEVAEDIHR